jgi:hypothetical protein
MMSVQLLVQEALVSLTLFALGVIGYILSKRGKTFCSHRHRLLTFKKLQADTPAPISDDKAACEKIETMNETAVLAKTTQVKNAAVRKRARRQARNKELVQMVTEQPLLGEASADKEVHESPYTPSVDEAAELGSEESVEQELAEPIAEEDTTEPGTQDEAELSEHFQQEDTTEPGTQDEAELSEHFQQDECDSGDSSQDPALAPVCDEADVRDEFVGYEPSVQDSDDGNQDFDIPATPPNEEAMMYPMDDVLFTETPVDILFSEPPSVQTFTDGSQIFEPVLSPDGQQLYTDGQQVFMLACVEASPTPAPCFGQLPNTYLDSPCPSAFCNQNYGCQDHGGNAFGNDAEDDLWNVSWDSLPQVYVPEQVC